MQTATNTPRAPRMLSTLLAGAMFSVSVVVLLIYGGLEMLNNFQIQDALIASRQQVIAQNAGQTVSNFIHENFSSLESAVWLSNLEGLPPQEQRIRLQRLLGDRPALRRIALVDEDGRIVTQSSRLSMYVSWPQVNQFQTARPPSKRNLKRSISSVYIDSVTFEPMLTLAVAVIDVFGTFRGSLVAELNLKSMWDIVDRIRIGERGYVYVSDSSGNLLAFYDTARVLKGENVAHLKTVSEFIGASNPDSGAENLSPGKAARYRGIQGRTVVGTFVPLATPNWVVVAEVPWDEAYREIGSGILTAVLMTVVMAAVAGFLGLSLAHRLAAPVIGLTATAERIAAGERELQAKVGGPREIAHLAVAFNSMTAQLRQSLKQVEDRCAEVQRTQEALRLSEERVRFALEGTTDGIWDWHLQTDRAYFSPRWFSMLGYAADEFPGCFESFARLIHPEDRAAAESTVQAAIAGNRPFSMEIRLQTKQGGWCWILSRGKVVEWDRDGKPVRMAGSHADISERKQAEMALREEKRFSDTLIDGMPGTFFVFDQAGRFIRLNRRFENITGYSFQEIKAKHPADFFGGEERERIENGIREVFTRGESEIEANFINRDGHITPYYFKGLRITIGDQPHLLGIGVDISERKRAENEAVRLQALLRAVIMQSPVAMVMALPDGTVELFNQSCREILGVADDADLRPGINLKALQPVWKDYNAAGELIPLQESALFLALEGKFTRSAERRVVRRDGSERWIFVDAVPVHDAAGKIIAGFLLFQDITDRKQAERDLLASERKFRTVVENAQPIIFILDGDGIITLSEGQALARLGFRPGQAVGMSAFHLYRHHPSVLNGIEAALEGRSNRTICIVRDAVFDTVFSPYILPDGRQNGIIGIALDITERNRAEAAAKSHQERLALALEGADLGSWDWDIRTGGTRFDERWAAMLGYRLDEIEPGVESWESRVHPDDLPRVRTTLNAHLRGETTFYETEHRMKHKSGHWVWIQDRGRVMERDSQGRPLRAAGTHLDISERKKAEETLRKYERIVSTTQDMMGLVNREYIYEAVNESYLAALKRTRDQIVGRTVAEVIGAKRFGERIQIHLEEAMKGRLVRFREVMDYEGLGRRTVDVSYVPILDPSGAVEGVVFNTRDITETRKLEEQVIHSQKIDSIGTLAGGVAHEINNPINGIMNYAQLILDRLEFADPQDPLRTYASEILRETRRVAGIVRNLLTFARHEKQSHSPARLADIVASVLSLVKTVMRHDQITLDLAIPDDLPHIKCRSQQIQQVLMNLLTNARDALNDRYPGHDPQKKLRVSATMIEKQQGKHIRMTVEDNGPGIPPRIRDQIFDPFFTTKPKGTGTGLGLSISYGILKDHNGELSVESEPGRYTRFHVDLPVDNGWTLSDKGAARDG